MKLLFTDLDGTLLNDNKTISANLQKGLQTMLNHGHKLVLTSGRPFESIVQVKESLGLSGDGIYISAFNGGILADCNTKKILFNENISRTHAIEILDFARDFGIHAHTYTPTAIVSYANTKELQFYTRHITLETIVNDSIDSIIGETVPKLIAIDLEDKNHLYAFQAELHQRMGDVVTTLFSNDRYLEIISKEAGKGQTVLYLSKLLNVALEDTYAIGDAENDLSMLQAAGTGIAMINGTKALCDAADYVTKHTNNEDGLLEVLEEFGFLC